MRIGGIEIKRRAWISMLFAAACIVLWWLWTGAKIPATALASPAVQPAVRLTKMETDPNKSDDLLRERAEYLDPTPLFFPTEWNFGQGALQNRMKRQPGEIFGYIEPNVVFGDEIIKRYNPEAVAPPGSLAEIVNSGNESPFAGVGEGEVKPTTLPVRDGFLEVKTLREGKTIVAQALVGIPASNGDFVPAEFLVAVGSEGLISQPILMTGSGREEQEVFLRTYLAKTFHVGERLTPGMYRILIGP